MAQSPPRHPSICTALPVVRATFSWRSETREPRARSGAPGSYSPWEVDVFDTTKKRLKVAFMLMHHCIMYQDRSLWSLNMQKRVLHWLPKWNIIKQHISHDIRIHHHSYIIKYQKTSWQRFFMIVNYIIFHQIYQTYIINQTPWRLRGCFVSPVLLGAFFSGWCLRRRTQETMGGLQWLNHIEATKMLSDRWLSLIYDS